MTAGKKRLHRLLIPAGEEHKDAAALAMAGEALMNLHPWEYYHKNGEMKDSAQAAEQLIMKALDLDPDNPLANHLLIHVSEASSPLRRGPVPYTAKSGSSRIGPS